MLAPVISSHDDRSDGVSVSVDCEGVNVSFAVHVGAFGVDPRFADRTRCSHVGRPGFHEVIIT